MIVLLVALLVAVGAFVVALAAIDRFAATGPSSSPVDGAGASSAAESSGEVASPSAGATTAGVTAAAVTFDHEPLGPLRAEAALVARVLGAARVAALPTAFDRSLRLGRPGSGACLEGVPGEPARSLSVDLLTGRRVGGTLRVTPSDRPEEAVTLALSRFAGLDAGTWYSVRLGWSADDAITIEIRERDGGRAVDRRPLTPDAGGRGPASGSLCLEALDTSERTAIHVDNLRVSS